MSDSENPVSTPPTKDEIVRDIAKAISERRKSRNLTIEKVFQTIKIRIPYLEAIEAGRWDQLPGDVFIRSFIKRYADHLGLDGEKLLAPYFALNNPPEKKSGNVPQILKGNEITSVQVIAVALVGIVLIVFIKLLTQEKSSPPQVSAANAIVASSTETTPTGLIASATISNNVNSHQMEVYSPNSLWLRITSRDKNFEGFIPQNSTWTWKGEGPLSVRLGHTKEVSIVFDGKPVSLLENQKKLELPFPS